EVVRSWFGRQSHVVETVAALVSGAEMCASAIKKCDWLSMGLCARRYWEQKKLMAAGCEPEEVALLISNLYERSVADAAWLAGAGGGGFLYVLLQEGKTIQDLTQTIGNVQGCESMTVHSVEIDQEPLTVDIS
uniref:GHMP kinase C-terminal domain-containing protein n=1 Tax=Plectus sambesii TaxID=2011161 RepID=A0A914V2R6_9BILA